MVRSVYKSTLRLANATSASAANRSLLNAQMAGTDFSIPTTVAPGPL